MRFFTNDHSYSCFDALDFKKKLYQIKSKHEVKEKKIYIELRQFCLICFPESTHSMELRMTNFTGYMYYKFIDLKIVKELNLFRFLFLILFFRSVSLILLYV